MPARWTLRSDNMQGHSPIELERQLTENRIYREALEESHEELTEDVEALRKKLALHEKAILGILGLLQVVLQDKYPAIAALLKAMMP